MVPQFVVGFLGFVSAAVGLLVVWMLVKSSLAHHRDLVASWGRAAESLGGHLVSRRSLLTPMKITAVVNDVRIVVDHYTTGGKGQQKHTRIAASSNGPSFDVAFHREHALSGLTKALGAEDLDVGVATIDEHFIIKSSDPDLCRALLETDVRSALQSAPIEYSFMVERGTTKGMCALLEDNATTLVRAAEATATIANGAGALKKRWKQLADELGGTTTDADVGRSPSQGASATITAMIDGAGVVIDTIRIDAGGIRRRTRTFTRVRAQHRSIHALAFTVTKDGILDGLSRMFGAAEEADKASPLRELGYTLRVSSKEGTPSPLEALDSALAELAPDVVADDGKEVSVVLAGVVFDASIVSSAGALAARLVEQASAGAYR